MTSSPQTPQNTLSSQVWERALQIRAQPPVKKGVVVRSVGMRLEARGISAPLGATCRVVAADGRLVSAEVVGFSEGSLYLLPFEEQAGIGLGSTVEVTSKSSSIGVGKTLLGRVIDAEGNPLDGMRLLTPDRQVSLAGSPINPMDREPISRVLDVGVRSINSILTLGRGQRIGLIAGSGVGKSVLLGMLARYTSADVVVIGLIGERGREVQEFIRNDLGKDGLEKAVVIAAPANVAPVLRVRSVLAATAIAESFRDSGKDVLLLIDSLTRVAHAQREVGLAVGEPPTAKGYPPSVFGLLPGIIERAGVGRAGHGSITAIYTVLAEGDDSNDPIVDLARASLDGQVMLSRRLADAAFYPAIDVAGSISRLMPALLGPKELAESNRFRRLWTLYQQSEDLLQVGAYQSGSNPDLDEAIKLRPAMESFLRQDMQVRCSIDESRSALSALLAER